MPESNAGPPIPVAAISLLSDLESTLRKRNPAATPVPSIGKMGGIYGLSDPMASLFEKYGVTHGDFRALAWALAGAHEPGFKATKTGRPRELDAELFNSLVNLLATAPDPLKVSDRKLAKIIADKFPTRAPKWEALRKHVRKARAFAAVRRHPLPHLLQTLLSLSG